MKCRRPFVKGLLAHACGQCMPCRIDRKRLWAHRMVLESLTHKSSVFATLTYSDEHLPEGNTLVPEHVQLWLKRLRKAVSPAKIRYFVVGEYGHEGKRGWNPHYHAALFGFEQCIYGGSVYSKEGKSCCYWCDLVRDTWGKGNIKLGGIGFESTQYISDYVTKKMTFADDQRLQGRAPEFARMSLRPGIGASAMQDTAKALLSTSTDNPHVDVASALRHGSRLMPLGRYLRGKLRESLGRPKDTPVEDQWRYAKELQALYLDHILAEKAAGRKPQKFGDAMASEGSGKAAQMVWRLKNIKKRVL